MDIGFVLVADKKFGLYGKNQRNLSCFSGFRWFLTGKLMLFSFLKILVGLYTALWQPFLYQNPNSTGCSTISCISL